MTDSVSYEKAASIADDAIRLMREHHIIPHEKNFAIWYTYVTERDASLNREIEILLSSEDGFTPKVSADLYQRFISHIDNDDGVNNITSKLEEELSALLGTLSSAGKGADQYGETLKAAGQALHSHSLTTDNIKTILDGVVSATQKMQDENSQLHSRLQETTQEINTLHEDLDAMREQASTDALTGIANRRLLEEELQLATSVAMAEKTPLSLVMLDIDKFKVFNDTHGHLVGDRVLKLLAATITSQVKGRDTAARYGGEEFAVLLPETSMDGAMVVGDAIRESISSKRLKNIQSGLSLGTITISAGVTAYNPGESIEDFIARADKALYAAKDAGRNRVISAPPPGKTET